ncbi:GNAT family N-acetyltransferase [Paenibacillus taiwanensis]|uniref:GNAT family N-acetyltransferase n=1 Tax=Paenibacillus taiwanensis TaxID=401638 RepID=UPI000415FEB9|nr:GNAT family N-acetyltransferase [Paenibacillus taiwanensis]
MMVRMPILVVLLGLLFMVFSGCENESSDDEKTAEQYVEQHGYQVISRQGEVQKYVLEKNKLTGSTENILYQQSWGVQSVEPDKYFGKEITVYPFTVKNHPLEKIYHIETTVNVMICEGQVIGGTSMPAQGNEAQMGETTDTLDQMPLAARLISSGHLFGWVTDGEFVSIANITFRSPRHGVINSVYTPPEHRKRGYASALVASLCDVLLNKENLTPILYADTANPHSNKVYQGIGFKASGLVHAIKFVEKVE